MTVECFAEKVKNALQKRLGDTHCVLLQEIEKNNGICLMAVTIRTKDKKISPTIYLEPYWRAYEKGATFSELICEIEQFYQDKMPAKDVDLTFFYDYEKVKDQIHFRLLDAESNQKRLQKIPHLFFLDLSICFYYSFSDPTLGDGAILIHDTHIKQWDVSAQTLFEQSLCNMQRDLPVQIVPIEKILSQLLGKQADFTMDEQIDPMPMYVMSNEQHTYGASCMVYPGVMEQLGKRFQRNFYILPSSIHERVTRFAV